MGQDVYLCSLCKQQPQVYFDAKTPAVADESVTTTLTFKALEIWYAMFCSRRWRFDMPCSRKARSVAVVCWQGVLEFQSEVHSSTIPRTRSRLVEPVLVEPVLLPPPPPGAVVLNK